MPSFMGLWSFIFLVMRGLPNSLYATLPLPPSGRGQGLTAVCGDWLEVNISPEVR